MVSSTSASSMKDLATTNILDNMLVLALRSLCAWEFGSVRGLESDVQSAYSSLGSRFQRLTSPIIRLLTKSSNASSPRLSVDRMSFLIFSGKTDLFMKLKSLLSSARFRDRLKGLHSLRTSFNILTDSSWRQRVDGDRRWCSFPDHRDIPNIPSYSKDILSIRSAVRQ